MQPNPIAVPPHKQPGADRTANFRRFRDGASDDLYCAQDRIDGPDDPMLGVAARLENFAYLLDLIGGGHLQPTQLDEVANVFLPRRAG